MTNGVEGLGVSEVTSLLEQGSVTSKQLVERYLARIAAYDRAYADQPGLHAIVCINEHALAEAEQLDAERAAGSLRGPLHGVPILVKDNIDVAGMPTSGGCVALRDYRPRNDAAQVARLRDAGAIVLAKANLDELAWGSSGLSSAGGQTRNPWDQRRSPGGSSAGSAVGVAASYAPAAIGSDTGGSIRVPAAHNNLVGVRPTYGLSSRSGALPLTELQDVLGPITRTVRDAALLLDVTVGADVNDSATAASAGRVPDSYLACLGADALSGARLGLLTNSEYLPQSGEAAGTYERMAEAVRTMRSQGAQVIDCALPPSLVKALRFDGVSVTMHEARDALNAYFRRNANAAADGSTSSTEEVLTLARLIESGTLLAEVVPWVSRMNSMPDPNPDYERAIAERLTAITELGQFMDTFQLDALVYPSVTAPAHVLDGGTEAEGNGQLSPLTGFPAVSVPAGLTAGGLPVGLELLGRPWSEPTLLALAYGFEQATNFRALSPESVPELV